MLPGRMRFLAGLFLATLATLLLELLNTRLLSVITWYHLSFFAVSTAMFGMSVGAIRVYLVTPLHARSRVKRLCSRSRFRSRTRSFCASRSEPA
jgi:hypothetical protein